MGFGWSSRPYTAPFLRDVVYNSHNPLNTEEKGNVMIKTSFMRHIPFATRLSSLPISESNSGQFGGNGGCSSTLDVQSLVPNTIFGDQCDNKMMGTDIFFLPKPTQLLAFAIPVFVLMPNLTVFARQWFFYGPK